MLVCFVIEEFTLDTFEAVGFRAIDITDPERMYTVVTSMYSHAGPFHLLFNVLGIAFIGSLLEQRIGTRPYIILYFLTGLCGTLTFAGAMWNDRYALAVGASGAISGVLGGLVRLYPREKFTAIVLFLPLRDVPLWIVVAFFMLLQLFFASGDTNIAWQAHLGGLAAGFLLVPFVSKLPLHKRVRRAISLSALRRMSTTPELKAILRRIEDEEVQDVRSAWIEHFLSKARCPYCGASIVISRGNIRCRKGHLL